MVLYCCTTVYMNKTTVLYCYRTCSTINTPHHHGSTEHYDMLAINNPGPIHTQHTNTNLVGAEQRSGRGHECIEKRKHAPLSHRRVGCPCRRQGASHRRLRRCHKRKRRRHQKCHGNNHTVDRGEGHLVKPAQPCHSSCSRSTVVCVGLLIRHDKPFFKHQTLQWRFL